MHYIKYLLVIALVAIVIALIIDAQKHAPPKQSINNCPSCGALSALTGDLIDHHVRCTNLECAMVGPKGRNEGEAVASWNKLSTVCRSPMRHKARCRS